MKKRRYRQRQQRHRRLWVQANCISHENWCGITTKLRDTLGNGGIESKRKKTTLFINKKWLIRSNINRNFLLIQTHTPIIPNNSNLKWLVWRWYGTYILYYDIQYTFIPSIKVELEKLCEWDVERERKLRLEELNEMFDHCAQWISDLNPIEKMIWSERNKIAFLSFLLILFFHSPVLVSDALKWCIRYGHLELISNWKCDILSLYLRFSRSPAFTFTLTHCVFLLLLEMFMFWYLYLKI